MIPTLPTGNKIDYLVGSASDFNKQVLIPYDPLVCDFLNRLSAELLRDKLAREYPDIISFGFWCRKANIAKLKEQFSETRLRLGLGLVFHISPSNVPVNFAFSFAFSILSGNSNIVRVPSKDYPQTGIICNAITRVLSDERFGSIAKMTAFVRYERDDEITRAFSEICNGRIIWGGTQTIRDIRRLPVPERAIEVAFADRYSFCTINAERLSKCSEKQLLYLAEGFYNDTYLMDQNACSSPHLVVWLGNGKALSGIKSRFWESVYKTAAAKYVLTPVSAVDKLTMLYENAIELQEVSSVSKYENLLYVLKLNHLPNNMEDIRGKYGYFYEFSVKSIDEIAHIVNEKYQTLTYYGIDHDELVTFVLDNKLFGIDRIVPIGSAMDISVIWDGYDLVRTLSRICDVK